MCAPLEMTAVFMMVPAALAVTPGSLSESSVTRRGSTPSSHTLCFPSGGTLAGGGRRGAGCVGEREQGGEDRFSEFRINTDLLMICHRVCKAGAVLLESQHYVESL